MEKIFHLDSPRTHYHCDAAVVWCFDHRFSVALRKTLQRVGISHPDIIQVAGGAKALASSEDATGREFLLDQIQKSKRLHGTDRVVLMVHSDCGAYGGLAAFGGDAKLEAQHHAAELARAAARIEQNIPGMKVAGYHVDFDGVWAAYPESSR